MEGCSWSSVCEWDWTLTATVALGLLTAIILFLQVCIARRQHLHFRAADRIRLIDTIAGLLASEKMYDDEKHMTRNVINWDDLSKQTYDDDVNPSGKRIPVILKSYMKTFSDSTDFFSERVCSAYERMSAHYQAGDDNAKRVIATQYYRRFLSIFYVATPQIHHIRHNDPLYCKQFEDAAKDIARRIAEYGYKEVRINDPSFESNFIAPRVVIPTNQYPFRGYYEHSHRRSQTDESS